MAKSRMITQANRREWRKLIAATEAARNVIWAHAPNRDTRWNDCLWLASTAERKAFADAQDAEHAFECRMVDEERGYRASTGVFMPYGVSLLADPRTAA